MTSSAADHVGQEEEETPLALRNEKQLTSAELKQLTSAERDADGSQAPGAQSFFETYSKATKLVKTVAMVLACSSMVSMYVCVCV